MSLSQVPPEMLAEIGPINGTFVDALKDEASGGYWVLGSDGGVFAVGGATFYGAYTGYQNQDPNRTFSHIITNDAGGYRLVSNWDEIYGQANEFGPAPSKTDKEEVVAPPTVPKTTDESAKVFLQSQLDLVGLGALATSGFGPKGELGALDYFNQLGGTQGAANTVLFEMRKTNLYTAKFPAMAARQAAGLAPIDEGTYMEWRDAVKGILQGAGLPPSFYDSEDDFAAFIGGDVSAPELKQRVDDGYRAMERADPQVRAELSRLFGIGDGQLAAFFLDPTRAEPMLMDAARQAEISGAAQIAGFGGLTVAEAANLQQKGMGFGEAQQAFGALGQQKELFNPLAGDMSGDESITRGQQLAAAGGDVGAQANIKKQARKRTAVFEGGGGFATGAGGVSGLGDNR